MRELLNHASEKHPVHRPDGVWEKLDPNALDEQAWRQKHSVQYWRTGRLLEILAQGLVDGSWLKYLKQL